MEGEVFVFGFLAGLLCGVFVTMFIMTSQFEKDAIQRSYALYCPLTGNFAWKGECE